MFKKITAALVGLVLTASPVLAQLNLTYTSFQPGQSISAAQFTANFTSISANALNRTGGTMTGTLTLNGGTDVNGSFTIGSDNLQPFDSTGKLKEISSTYFASLSGASITGILEANIADGTVFPRLAADETIAGTWTFSNAPVMSGASISSGTIPEASIADGSVYARLAANETVSGTWTFGGITVSSLTCTGCIGATQIAATAVAANTYGSASIVPVFAVDADGRLTSVTNTTISIAESAIVDGSLLARLAANETVAGSWTFSGTSTMTYVESPVNSFLSLKSATSGTDQATVFISSDYLAGSSPAVAFSLFDNAVGTTTTPLTVYPTLVMTRTLVPAADNTYAIGDSSLRFTTINLALPQNLAPSYVVVNKGGGGADANSALGYIAGFTGTKVAGSCTFTIVAGVVTNVTGC